MEERGEKRRGSAEEEIMSQERYLHRKTDLTSLCGRPAAEKMGIFCPLAILFMASMAEMPVWIISSGYIRDHGLIG